MGIIKKLRLIKIIAIEKAMFEIYCHTLKEAFTLEHDVK